ncbi:VOC family protein [Streptomyces antimicrobicus]|uniref:VOC family protein n=1 Tax=Streptomyces antimicrobicus TaxID=2883108 RepID=A0ABS8B3M9_9ACTN|nr:VOC family protein [Streptomyces antimicrobicus]MCB5179216.1 VOC family protein [Streptomyces antimicrobicus]
MTGLPGEPMGPIGPTSAEVSGAPCWVNLMTHDIDAAERFYGAVLGWSFRPTRLGPAFRVAEGEGVPVAGIGAQAGTFSVAVAWTPYFAVADADAAVSRIRERTGTVAVGPVRFEGAGRGVLAADPQGAVFGLWEGRVFADWLTAPRAAPAWVELRTRDAFAAAVFYGEVLLWATGESGCCDVSYERDRIVLRHDGRVVARLDGGPAQEASAEPVRRPHWHVHFRVAELDASVAAAAAHGGDTVAVDPSPGPEGRFATLRDPEGALFDVWEPPATPP